MTKSPIVQHNSNNTPKPRQESLSDSFPATIHSIDDYAPNTYDYLTFTNEGLENLLNGDADHRKSSATSNGSVPNILKSPQMVTRSHASPKTKHTASPRCASFNEHPVSQKRVFNAEDPPSSVANVLQGVSPGAERRSKRIALKNALQDGSVSKQGFRRRSM